MNGVANKEKIMVYINWDGFSWDYYRLANRGYNAKTPVIDSLVHEGVLFTNACTGIPSITNPMQTALVTGAWPAVTGNSYLYYDKKKNIVIKQKRENNGETIAEAAIRQGLNVTSLHQFILENRGTKEGSLVNPYFKVGNNADYSVRFNAAIKLVKAWGNNTGVPNDVVTAIPDFMALYMDDLDGLGHNDWFTYGVPAVSTEAGRKNSIVKRLEEMDGKLGEFIEACKDTGFYGKMSFLLVTDHGMTPYGRQGKAPDEYRYSKLPDLVNSIENLGYKIEILSEGRKPHKSTDIVLVSTGLEIQLSFTGEHDNSDVEVIKVALETKKYSGKIMRKEELEERGAVKDFADLLISPEPPYFFKKDSRPHKAGGQHDSLDESSQHVFALMWGKGIKKGLVYSDKVYIIDFARTMSALLRIDGPKDATGRLLDQILADN
jgi:Uncharacterized proteins of the AP superfamily